ncbi:Ff.00g064750.m01.CDS01, partial [Fusarium sp. VM40]
DLLSAILVGLNFCSPEIPSTPERNPASPLPGVYLKCTECLQENQKAHNPRPIDVAACERAIEAMKQISKDNRPFLATTSPCSSIQTGMGLAASFELGTPCLSRRQRLITSPLNIPFQKSRFESPTEE